MARRDEDARAENYPTTLLAMPAESAGDGPYDDDSYNDDPYDDDLAERLAALAPGKRYNRTTVVLAALVLVVIGFIGGVLVQRGAATAGNSTNGAAGFGGFGPGGVAGGQVGSGQPGNGQANGGQGRGGAGGGASTTGTVTLVDGSTVYVTTADGQVLIVKTNSTTVVRTEQNAALKDLKAGATVTVVGATGADGAVNATQVIAQMSGAK